MARRWYPQSTYPRLSTRSALPYGHSVHGRPSARVVHSYREWCQIVKNQGPDLSERDMEDDRYFNYATQDFYDDRGIVDVFSESFLGTARTEKPDFSDKPMYESDKSVCRYSPPVCKEESNVSYPECSSVSPSFPTQSDYKITEIGANDEYTG